MRKLEPINDEIGNEKYRWRLPCLENGKAKAGHHDIEGFGQPVERDVQCRTEKGLSLCRNNIEPETVIQKRISVIKVVVVKIPVGVLPGVIGDQRKSGGCQDRDQQGPPRQLPGLPHATGPDHESSVARHPFGFDQHLADHVIPDFQHRHDVWADLDTGLAGRNVAQLFQQQTIERAGLVLG